MISINNLSVNYSENPENCVLSNIFLEIPTGSSMVIIGPSGTGKSTLLKAMAGLISDYVGNILLDGQPMNPFRHIVGYLPQNYGLLPWLTLQDNILLGLDLKKCKEVVQEEMKEIVTSLGLIGLEKRYPHEVSGGQRQRAALARVFLLKPDILLMDEPFSALDAITREEIQKEYLSLWQRYKITAVIVTHYVEEAVFLGQNIVVMSSQKGKILAQHVNPLFGLDDIQRSADFYKLCKLLKFQLKDMR